MKKSRRQSKPKKKIQFTDKLIKENPTRKVSEYDLTKRHITWGNTLVVEPNDVNLSSRKINSLDSSSNGSSSARSDKPKSILKSSSFSDLGKAQYKQERGHFRNNSSLANKSRFFTDKNEGNQSAFKKQRAPQLDGSKHHTPLLSCHGVLCIKFDV